MAPPPVLAITKSAVTAPKAPKKNHTSSHHNHTFDTIKHTPSQQNYAKINTMTCTTNYLRLFQSLHLNTIEDFFNFVSQNFAYGWMNQNHQLHTGTNDAESYYLQSPTELLNSKTGNCWDITELCRCWFQTMTNLPIATYYIFYDDHAGCPSHTIITYKQSNQFHWFEPMFHSYPSLNCHGIHHYSTRQDLLQDAVQKIINYQQYFQLLPDSINHANIHIYEYKQPPYHINGYEMRNHINQSHQIQ